MYKSLLGCDGIVGLIHHVSKYTIPDLHDAYMNLVFKPEIKSNMTTARPSSHV